MTQLCITAYSNSKLRQEFIGKGMKHIKVSRVSTVSGIKSDLYCYLYQHGEKRIYNVILGKSTRWS